MTIAQVADTMLEAGISLQQGQDEIAKYMLEAALRRTGGNKVRAAKLLRVHRNTLNRNLVTHNVNWKAFRWPTSRRKSLAVPAAG